MKFKRQRTAAINLTAITTDEAVDLNSSEEVMTEAPGEISILENATGVEAPSQASAGGIKFDDDATTSTKQDSFPVADTANSEQEKPTKKSLRFADTSETSEISEADQMKPMKKSLRFADDPSAKQDEQPRKKKSLRFAEPDSPPSPKRTKKSVRFAGSDARKSVRFSDDLMRRKYSMDAPVAVRKNVRFLLPTMDHTGKATGARVYFPGVKRRRRSTVKTSTVKVYPDPPLWLVMYLMDTQRFIHLSGPRRAKACRFLAWIIGVSSAIAFVIGLAMLLLYLQLRPQIPRLKIVKINFKSFHVERLEPEDLIEQQVEDSGNYFTYLFYVDAVVSFSYENVNAEVDIYNEYAEITFFYKGTEWGKSYLRDFLVPRRTQQVLKVRVMNTMLLQLNVGYTLDQEYSSQKFEMVSEFVVKARLLGAAQWTISRHFWIRVRCYIVIAFYVVNQNCRTQNY